MIIYNYICISIQGDNNLENRGFSELNVDVRVTIQFNNKNITTMNLLAEVICNDKTVFKVDVPFDLECFKCAGAEYTRNWCKVILLSYQVGYFSPAKLILYNEHRKKIKTYRACDIDIF